MFCDKIFADNLQAAFYLFTEMVEINKEIVSFLYKGDIPA